MLPADVRERLGEQIRSCALRRGLGEPSAGEVRAAGEKTRSPTEIAGAAGLVERALPAQVERNTLPGLRWTADDKLHLTLRFFGTIAPENLPALCAACATAAQSLPRGFELRIQGASAFPAAKRARVLWLGIVGGAAELKQLSAELARATDSLGLPKDDREYTPHLTIARLTHPRNATALLEQLQTCELTARVSCISLVRSHLGSNAYYEVLREFAFARASSD